MRLLRRCLAYFRPDLPRIVGSLVLTFLATLCGLLQPVTFKVLFDSVFAGKAPLARALTYPLAGVVVPLGWWVRGRRPPYPHWADGFVGGSVRVMAPRSARRRATRGSRPSCPAGPLSRRPARCG